MASASGTSKSHPKDATAAALKYVRELLGHASISITLDTYSHVIEGMGNGLADAMDEAL